ncbi:MAG TPA: hypothetical protein VN948_07470 [Terriglobales bacterium]|nr:hypothetical protein [Terriglobales bacterium]
MERPSRPRTTADLPDSVHQQLSMYAVAATAAGVGLLALAPPAEAKIIYTSTHHVIPQNHHYNLDLNHDGVADFNLSNHYYCGTDFCVIWLYALPAAGNAVEGVNGPLVPQQSCDPNDSMIASALSRGSRIGPKAPFCGGMMANVGWLATYGKWWNVNNRYLGLKFQVKGKTHYGWARLSVKGGGVKITATLTGYAYETIPGKAIIAGKTHCPAEDPTNDFAPGASLPNPFPDKPQPASLGALAMGAPGLSIWRREELVSARQ